MLEKIKYSLSVNIFSRQTRIKCIAVLTAITIAVITLLDLSISTMKVFDGERSYTVRYLNGTPASVLSGLNLKSDRYKITETSVKDRLTTNKRGHGLLRVVVVNRNIRIGADT